MRASLQHAWHWMHDEGASAGHWCSQHVLHDTRFWLYLLMAVALAAFIAVLFRTGGTVLYESFLAYPYGAL